MQQDEIVMFFDAHNVGFSKDAETAAKFYSEPCITARAGTARVNNTSADTVGFFKAVLEQYQARGCTHGDYDLLEVRGLGANSVIATLHWRYRNEGQQVL